MSFINTSVAGWQGIGGGLLPNTGSITGGGGMGGNIVMDNLAAGNPYATAPQTEGVWYGTRTKANTVATSTSLGNNARAAGAGSVSIGGSDTAAEGAYANGISSVALGGSFSVGNPGAQATADFSVALGGAGNPGNGPIASGPSSIAIGSGGTAGIGAQASAANSIAIGPASLSSGVEGTAIGYGTTNTVADQTTIGNGGAESVRFLNPSTVGNFAWNLRKVTLAGATPTPTMTQLLNGYLVCSNAGAYTLTMTNITGTLLDAAAPLQPVYTGMSFECEVVSSGAGGVMTLGAAAGVTIVGPTTTLAGTNLRLRYTRTGANSWDVRIIGTIPTSVLASAQKTTIVYNVGPNSGIIGAGSIIGQINTATPGSFVEVAASANFTFAAAAGTLTCNTTGLYLVQLSIIAVGAGDCFLRQAGATVTGTTGVTAGGSMSSTVTTTISAGQVMEAYTLTGINVAGTAAYPNGVCLEITRLA